MKPLRSAALFWIVESPKSPLLALGEAYLLLSAMALRSLENGSI